LWEGINQLEIENNQLKYQASSSITVVSRLKDLENFSLEQAEELYKSRKKLYVSLQKTQEDYSSFRQCKIKA